MAIFVILALFVCVFGIAYVWGFLLGVQAGRPREDISAWICDCSSQSCRFFGTYAQGYKAARKCRHSKRDVDLEEVLFEFSEDIRDVSDT